VAARSWTLFNSFSFRSACFRLRPFALATLGGSSFCFLRRDIVRGLGFLPASSAMFLRWVVNDRPRQTGRLPPHDPRVIFRREGSCSPVDGTGAPERAAPPARDGRAARAPPCCGGHSRLGACGGYHLTSPSPLLVQSRRVESKATASSYTGLGLVRIPRVLILHINKYKTTRRGVTLTPFGSMPPPATPGSRNGGGGGMSQAPPRRPQCRWSRDPCVPMDRPS